MQIPDCKKWRFVQVIDLNDTLDQRLTISNVTTPEQLGQSFEIWQHTLILELFPHYPSNYHGRYFFISTIGLCNVTFFALPLPTNYSDKYLTLNLDRLCFGNLFKKNSSNLSFFLSTFLTMMSQKSEPVITSSCL